MYLTSKIVIGATVVALGMAAGYANAAEGHRPPARPQVTQNVRATPTANARAENGSNSFSNGGDKVDVAPSVSFTEDYPDLMPVMDSCTVTDMEVYKAFLFGYASSEGKMTDFCVAKEIIPLFGKWFNTPRPDEAPYVKDVHGYVVQTFTPEEITTAAIGRGMACSRFEDIVKQTPWAGQCE